MIGSRLVLNLLRNDASVFVIDDNSRGKVQISGAEYAQIDATNYDDVLFHFDYHNITHIFNLAAYVAGVTFNMTHQFEMFAKNIELQTLPLHAAVTYGGAPFLQTSSVCVYGPGQNSTAREFHFTGEPTAANAGYSYAKRFGETAAKLASSETFRAVIVRPTNAYGVNDYFDRRAHVIPALIKKVLYDDEIVVNSSRFVKREFIFADDVAVGMMKALQHGEGGHAYLLGCTGESITIEGLVELIRQLCGMDHKKIVYNETPAGVDEMRFTDCRDTYRALKWMPRTALREGLMQVIEWYRKCEVI